MRGHSTSADTRSSPTWADRALSVAAVLGTLCILATIVSLTTGVRPVLFETGSMAPAISTGSLGLSRNVPATSVGPGDVVGVVRNDGVRATHRVESIDAVTGNSVAMTLKGDANIRPDPEAYVVTEVTRVYGTVPLLGYVAAWLKNPYTLALQALGVLALLAIAFAPKQGWHNSPTAQRLATGTAAATVIVLAVSGTQGSGDAHAALTGQATATGTINAGRPANPTSFTCANSGIIFSTVTLSWPNPGDPRYSYVLKSGSTEIAVIAPTASNPVSFQISQGLLTTIINILLGNSGAVTLYQRVGNFESSSGLTHTITTTLLPLGARCANPGTVTGPSGLQARGSEAADPVAEATAPSGSTTPSESPDPSESAPPESSSNAPEPPKDEKPELPPGGTLSESGAYAWFRDGDRVVIRDAERTEIEYEDTYPAGSAIAWRPGTEVLEITAPDGTVTTVTKVGDVWQTAVTPPPPPQPSPPSQTTPDPTVPAAPPPTRERPATTAPATPAEPPAPEEPGDP